MKKVTIPILLTLLWAGFCTNINAKNDKEEDEDSVSIMKKIDKKKSYQIDLEAENKPTESYADFTHTPQTSTFKVPIELLISTLQQKLNQKFTGLLYDDEKIEDDSLKLKAWKQGDFKIQYEGNTLTAEIPIKIWAVKRIGIAGLTYTDREVEGAIDVKLKSDLNLGKNWCVISQSTITGYTWIQKPTMKVAGADVPITYIVDKLIAKNKSKIEKMVDDGVRQNLPLKSYAQNLWEQVQQPVPVKADTYQAWIKFIPQKIAITPIVGANGKINSTIGIDCKVEVAVGIKPNVNINKQLPDCKLSNSKETGFELNILGDVPFSILDSVAMQNLKGKELGEGKHVITVDSISMFGCVNDLGIELFVHGFMNGKIYLTGTPYFDKGDKSIKMKDVDYKMKTKNLLAKAINLIFRPILKNKIENGFSIPMKNNFYLIQQMGQSKVLNNKWADNVYTTGKINDVEGGNIYVTPSGIQAELQLEGQINVSVR